MSNAAPKSDNRGGSGYGGSRSGSHSSNRGPDNQDGSGMYQQRYNPGSNQGGNWGSQGHRGNIDMPNLQALGELYFCARPEGILNNPCVISAP